MRVFRSLALCAGLLGLAGGCAFSAIEQGAAEHGETWALLRTDIERSALRERANAGSAPLVVMVEDFAVRGVDPISTETLWRHAAPVSGHLVGSDEAVLIPLRGRRLLAISRATGERMWEISLPGEAIIGMSMNDRWAAVTVVEGASGDERYRSRLILISMSEGVIRWQRGSAGALGAPALVDRHVAVSLGGELLVLSAGLGREKSRLRLPDHARGWGRIETRRNIVAILGDSSWLDLTRRDLRARELRGVPAPVFASFEGYDPGHDDAEGIRWWLPLSEPVGDRAPKERLAVMMVRRAVVGVALDADGQPAQARWAYLAPRGREHVAMEVSYGRVNLLDESGSLLSLSLGDGRAVASAEYAISVRGGLFLDMDSFDGLADEAPGEWFERTRLDAQRPVPQQLASLLRDPDPRLLPAQRLAIDLLWREGSEGSREVVRELALRDEFAEVHEGRASLRSRAQGHVVAAEKLDPGAARRLLTLRPSFAEPKDLDALPLIARQAAILGDQAAVPDIVQHLMHPGTPARALDDLARALCAFDAPDARAGVEKFLRAYHADAQAMIESRALKTALECLYAASQSEAIDAEGAAQVLEDVGSDPHTDPTLRSHLERVVALGGGPEGLYGRVVVRSGAELRRDREALLPHERGESGADDVSADRDDANEDDEDLILED